MQPLQAYLANHGHTIHTLGQYVWGLCIRAKHIPKGTEHRSGYKARLSRRQRLIHSGGGPLRHC